MKQLKVASVFLFCGILTGGQVQSHAGTDYLLRSDSSSIRNVKIDISRQRADQLLEQLPAGDPWLNKPDGSTLAWGEAARLETLMDMYEATNDRKYLDEVARRGDRLLTHRDDRRGVADGSGKSRPAWSMALKYVVAEGQLKDAAGKPVINIRSTPSAYNDSTYVLVIPGKNGRFSLKVTNNHYKRYEDFTDLSLNSSDERFVEKIVNDPMAPYSTKAGSYTDKSNLIRVNVVGKSAPKAGKIILKSIPLAYMGYIGIIYTPMLRFAESVKANPELKHLVPAADRFIRAAEESYADASERLWRNGPNKGEGYYLTCEKGESFPADNVGAPINFQAMHTCAQLSLYRLTGKKEYLERSEKMSNLLKNRLKHDQQADLYVWTYWFEPMTTTGWKPEDNLSANVKYFRGAFNIEDISHAVLDVSMVVEANKQGIVFTDTDVKRFSNTLLINVLSPDRTGVRRTVDGKGEYPAYFNALNGWLNLAGNNREVYEAIRQAYLHRGEETLAITAELLKWQERFGLSNK